MYRDACCDAAKQVRAAWLSMSDVLGRKSLLITNGGPPPCIIMLKNHIIHESSSPVQWSSPAVQSSDSRLPNRPAAVRIAAVMVQ